MPTQETAIVWRGGGRRWFSRVAACRAEARSLKKRCECEDGGDDSTSSYPDYTCHYHSADYYPRILARLSRHLAYNLLRSRGLE